MHVDIKEEPQFNEDFDVDVDFEQSEYHITAIWLYKDHGKCFSTSGPYIFPKFQYQWSLCGP